MRPLMFEYIGYSSMRTLKMSYMEWSNRQQSIDALANMPRGTASAYRNGSTDIDKRPTSTSAKPVR